MFEPLPNYEAGGGWYSADAVMPEDVYAAIAEAEQKIDKAERCCNKLVENSGDEEYGQGLAFHESSAEREAASLARIQAVLLSALYIEGAVNAWGVLVTGEIFFKAHIERSNLESKIALILALAGKGCIPSNHAAILSIRDLFERRNQIAHRKTKEWQGVHNHKLHIREMKAESDLEACKAALSNFRELLIEFGQSAAFIGGITDKNDEP